MKKYLYNDQLFRTSAKLHIHEYLKLIGKSKGKNEELRHILFTAPSRHCLSWICIFILFIIYLFLIKKKVVSNSLTEFIMKKMRPGPVFVHTYSAIGA